MTSSLMKRCILLAATILAAVIPAASMQKNKAPKTTPGPASTSLSEEDQEILKQRELLENLELLRNYEKIQYMEFFTGKKTAKSKEKQTTKTPAKSNEQK